MACLASIAIATTEIDAPQESCAPELEVQATKETWL